MKKIRVYIFPPLLRVHRILYNLLFTVAAKIFFQIVKLETSIKPNTVFFAVLNTNSKYSWETLRNITSKSLVKAPYTREFLASGAWLWIDMLGFKRSARTVLASPMQKVYRACLSKVIAPVVAEFTDLNYTKS